jgi:hypothetical protein
MLGRPHGVPVDGTPFSIDYGVVNGCAAAFEYKCTTGQSPLALLEAPQYQAYFFKIKTPRTQILSFAPEVLTYLLGHTDVLPGELCGTRDMPGSNYWCNGCSNNSSSRG